MDGQVLACAGKTPWLRPEFCNRIRETKDTSNNVVIAFCAAPNRRNCLLYALLLCDFSVLITLKLKQAGASERAADREQQHETDSCDY